MPRRRVQSRKGSGGSFLLGVLLFLASFVVLFWNEGKANLAEIARQAQVIEAEPYDSTAEGSFVSVTGDVSVQGTVGDSLYLKPGPYLAIKRHVQMFAWTEVEETDDDGNVIDVNTQIRLTEHHQPSGPGSYRFERA